MEEEVKVSELPIATNVDDDDLVMIVQDGYNKQITKEKLLENINNTFKQNNITITSDFTIDDNSCFKSQNFVNIGINIYNTNSTYGTYTWVKIARLPVGCRPSTEKYLSGVALASGLQTPNAIPIMVDSDGYINAYPVASNLKRIIANGIITL